MKPHCILTVAGSDSCAGAGIQADLKTFAALNCYGVSVITALTAQNTQGVQGVLPIPALFVKQQLDSLFSDIEISAIKVGMLHNQDIIEMIAQYFKTSSIPLILDPVMVAKGGSLLLDPKAIRFLQAELIPLATVITPNIPEAEVLLNCKIQTELQMQEAASKLGQNGAQAVLLKGGHLNSPSAKDCLYITTTHEFHWYESPRVETTNTHGTGCTLSSAIAAYLGKGLVLHDAIAYAKEYLLKAINAGKDIEIGHGHGPLKHS